ncbi:unnamed protein product [Calypogeia fissa]
MGTQTGTQTELGAKSYVPLNLGTSGTSTDDKGVPGPGAANGLSEWPFGHASGPLVMRVAPWSCEWPRWSGMGPGTIAGSPTSILLVADGASGSPLYLGRLPSFIWPRFNLNFMSKLVKTVVL